MKRLLPMALLCLIACKKSEPVFTPSDVLTGDLCNYKIYGLLSKASDLNSTKLLSQFRESDNSSISGVGVGIGSIEGNVGCPQPVIINNTYYILSWVKDSADRLHRVLERIDMNTGISKPIALSFIANNIDYYSASHMFYAVTDTNLIQFQIAGDSIVYANVLGSIASYVSNLQGNRFTDITINQTTGAIYLFSQKYGKANGVLWNATFYSYTGGSIHKIKEYSSEIFAPRCNRNDGNIYFTDFYYISRINVTTGELLPLAMTRMKYVGGAINDISGAVIEPCNNVYVFTMGPNMKSSANNYYSLFNCDNHKLYYQQTDTNTYIHSGFAITQ